MKIAVFSTDGYARHFLEEANRERAHEITYFEASLSHQTSSLAAGFEAVCVFVNDQVDAPVLGRLAELGVRFVALRCAGFNNVDLRAAATLGIRVTRVPAYSPHSVAEHTLAMILSLNRQLHRAYARVREGNFALAGLLGFDLQGRTAGVVGTGNIGAIVARILRGFGCRVLAHDLRQDADCLARGVEYRSFQALLEESDIVTLHCPLTPETHHLIDAGALECMREGVMLINTSRGALVDARAAVDALKSGKLGYLGLDVYEEEADLFFQDFSDQVIQDDVFARLLTFPNVLITGHQAFLTEEALRSIAETTLDNLAAPEQGGRLPNEVTPEVLAPADGLDHGAVGRVDAAGGAAG